MPSPIVRACPLLGGLLLAACSFSEGTVTPDGGGADAPTEPDDAGLVDSGQSADVARPVLRGRVLYSALAEDDGGMLLLSVFAAPLDGSAPPTRLTHPSWGGFPIGDVSPTLGPDGRVYFLREEQTSTMVMSVAADGTGERAESDEFLSGDGCFDLAVGADGLFAFTRYQPAGGGSVTAEVLRVGATGAATAWPAAPPSSCSTSIASTPDHAKLVVGASGSACPPESIGVFVAPLDATAAPTPFAVADAQWDAPWQVVMAPSSDRIYVSASENVDASTRALAVRSSRLDGTDLRTDVPPQPNAESFALTDDGIVLVASIVDLDAYAETIAAFYPGDATPHPVPGWKGPVRAAGLMRIAWAP